MMYPMRVLVAGIEGGSVFNHGVHEGVVSLINKIRSRFPNVDPNNEYHLYAPDGSNQFGDKPSGKPLPEDGITFLEDCGVKQTDTLFFQP